MLLILSAVDFFTKNFPLSKEWSIGEWSPDKTLEIGYVLAAYSGVLCSECYEMNFNLISMARFCGCKYLPCIQSYLETFLLYLNLGQKGLLIIEFGWITYELSQGNKGLFTTLSEMVVLYTNIKTHLSRECTYIERIFRGIPPKFFLFNFREISGQKAEVPGFNADITPSCIWWWLLVKATLALSQFWKV